MVPSPMAITSPAELPLTPVRLQSASNTLHGPDGSVLCDQELPLSCSMSGVPLLCPTAQTLLADTAEIAFSGAYGTLSTAGVRRVRDAPAGTGGVRGRGEDR